MRARILALAAAAAALTLPAVAQASAPTLGGRYVDRGTVRGVEYRVKLNVTNDGLEFEHPSFAEYTSGACDVIGEGLASYDDRPNATPIGPDGRFARKWIRGRFVDGGQVAVGSLQLRPCARRVGIIGFRARLTHTPNVTVPGRPTRCDRVSVRFRQRLWMDDAYELSEQGVGCTAAREMARRWYADCEAGTAAAEVCPIGGTTATCRRTAGGRLRPLAGVQCAAAGDSNAMVELEFHKACRPPPTPMYGEPLRLWAINIQCAAARAFDVDRLLGSGELTGPCPDLAAPMPWEACAPHANHQCRIRSFIYSGTGTAVEGRCRSLLERWKGLVFLKDYGI